MLTVDAARVYEELFVPALFAQWADAVVEAARVRPGDRVLDVACGTGVLARAAAGAVAPGGSVVGLDPSEGMLTVAAERARQIEWRRGVAESLPFPDASFDAVVSQFGLMFFEDRAGALREMLRVLRPERHMVVAVCSSLAEAPAYLAFTDLLERLFGKAVADGMRAPFCLGDSKDLESLFHEAGIASLRIEQREGLARYPSLETWMEADGKGWLQLDDAQHAQLLAAASRELGAFVGKGGRAHLRLPAVVVSAKA